MDKDPKHTVNSPRTSFRRKLKVCHGPQSPDLHISEERPQKSCVCKMAEESHGTGGFLSRRSEELKDSRLATKSIDRHVILAKESATGYSRSTKTFSFCYFEEEKPENNSEKDLN